MKVYIVQYGFYYEHNQIWGVYTSRYKANKAIKKHTQSEDYLLFHYANSKNGYINILETVVI
jgi:hypothetical protein